MVEVVKWTIFLMVFNFSLEKQAKIFFKQTIVSFITSVRLITIASVNSFLFSCVHIGQYELYYVKTPHNFGRQTLYMASFTYLSVTLAWLTNSVRRRQKGI